MQDTAFAPGSRPVSVASGSHGLSSSFSPKQIAQRPGMPCVVWSNTCGTTPNALRSISPSARGIVALGRKPAAKIPPVELIPSSPRIGPLITISGAGPLVDCQPPPFAARSRMTASQAASTIGKYSGRQPAITALIAAVCTVHSRSRWSMRHSTSSGERLVWARNSSTSASVAGITGRPSLQPFS